jgi:colanic acid/amylovoran/stewartan biosynthesis glycosyltransferase WcaL/AmsK/CpsK
MSNPINFALFRNNFIKLSETFIHDELRHHIRYQATVFARKHMNEDIYPGHKVISTDKGWLGPNSPLSLFYGVFGVYPPFFKEFEKGNFSLIHAHFGSNAYTAFPYATKFNIPLIVTLHGSEVTKLIGSERYNPSWFHYTLRKNEMFKKTTLFLAASKELKELIIEAGCPEEKVIVHRLGVDLTKFTPPKKVVRDQLNILMVGRFVPKKGFSYGIRSFANVLKANIDAKMTIIGDGPQKAQLQELISRLGIEDKIHMVGAKPHSFVVEKMKETDLVVTPSIVVPNMDRESGLIVAKEAAATGIPVVAHVHGGLPSIVDSGKTGFLVPERDVDAMTDSMILLLSNKTKRNKFGIAARKKMEKDFDIIKRNEALEDIYDKVISNQIDLLR